MSYQLKIEDQFYHNRIEDTGTLGNFHQSACLVKPALARAGSQDPDNHDQGNDYGK
jgi:hypothetical protein